MFSFLHPAHCFFREQPSNLLESVVMEDLAEYKIAVGKYFRDYDANEAYSTQFLNIQEAISVPGYDGYMGFYSADFIVLVLDDFIKFRQHVIPICIDNDFDLEEEINLQHGLIGTVSSWGFTNVDGQPSEVLKIAKLPTVEFFQCKREAPSNFKQFVTPDKFCAGNIGGGDAVCQGTVLTFIITNFFLYFF
jgi:hypothetical protein